MNYALYSTKLKKMQMNNVCNKMCIHQVNKTHNPLTALQTTKRNDTAKVLATRRVEDKLFKKDFYDVWGITNC